MLNQQFNMLLKEPQLREFMRARGSTIEDGTAPEKLATTLADRTDHYRKLVTAMGLKPQ
jgi:tripartite-type tricarboxylate transporter receptor subunit TctC